MAVFLPSFLLAFSIWFIHNVSLRYSEILTATVVGRANLDGRRNISSNLCTVTARCRATGYAILRNNAFGGRRKQVIDIPESALKYKQGDLYAFVPESMPEFGNIVFGSSVSSVEHYLSDTLFFHFPSEEYRKLPIRHKGSCDFAPQYMSVKGVQLEPDSVYVYGEPSVLDGIPAIFTEPLRLSYLDASEHGSVGLEQPSGVRLSRTSAEYRIVVNRYVTSVVTMDVKIKGLPAGKSVAVFPSSVKARVDFLFPLRVSLDSVDVAYVDYADFEQSRSGKCVLRTDNLPEGVLNVEFDTDIVDCVAE
ncbi:MAG: hypothetical protein ACI39U_09205 [Candidatus Cryptobacteroides sp.]